MKIEVAFVTTARSDYGPSKWLIHELFADERFSLRLIVSGAHLSPAHGLTVSEIEQDGWQIAARVPFLGFGDNDVSLGASYGIALTAFAQLFSESRPQIIVVNGDRAELLPILTAALLTRTPVAHLSGGDISEGAIDEQARHAVTKLSHLHFPSSNLSARRVLQMGEESWRVHMLGDLAHDHFTRSKFASPGELARLLGFGPDRRTLLVTFHAATVQPEAVARQASELMAALSDYDGSIVITGPAPDPGSGDIRLAATTFAKNCARAVYVENLGAYNYYGLMRLVGAMVGNSSSALNESPLVPLPVVNVGIRQQGRERGRNVIDVPAEAAAIRDGIRLALRSEFAESMGNSPPSIAEGSVARRIADVLSTLTADRRLLEKRFVFRPAETADVLRSGC